MNRDDLGNRMKTYYEQIPKTKLMRRMPVIIRLDGKAFHTFTRKFVKPFDEVLIKTMQETTKYLCENIQGCVLGYTQSDEISLVLIDYQTFNTDAWYDYEVQKMCSVSASMATVAFNKFFEENVNNLYYNTKVAMTNEEEKEWYNIYSSNFHSAMFDSRVFNIPKEEVTNYIYWRQLDASRNSIQMLGQAHFSHKELQHKSCNDIQDMLVLNKGINWNNLPIYQKRGSCVIKVSVDHEGWEPVYDKNIKIGEIRCNTERSNWIIDKEIPIFKGESRDYIEKLINVDI